MSMRSEGTTCFLPNDIRSPLSSLSTSFQTILSLSHGKPFLTHPYRVSYSVEENQDRTGDGEYARTTTEEDVNMLSRPIYSSSKESKHKPYRNPQKMESAKYVGKDAGEPFETASSQIKKTTGNTDDSRDFRDQYIPTQELDEGVAAVKDRSDSSKTATFGRNPIRAKVAKFDYPVQNDFMDTLSNAIDFFSSQESRPKMKRNTTAQSIDLGIVRKQFNTPQIEECDSDNERKIPYLDNPGNSSKFLGLDYSIDHTMHDNSTARFRHPQSKLIENKHEERVKTENSNLNTAKGKCR